MNDRPNSLAARDIAYYFHPATNARRHEKVGPMMIERGEGIYVFDDFSRLAPNGDRPFRAGEQSPVGVENARPRAARPHIDADKGLAHAFFTPLKRRTLPRAGIRAQV